ncbi:MAG TPA: TonB-dependent receptor [Burkholderiales bacterium]|nr:TonB-dependent receptor [Burkholderiales bacterium]
MTTVGAPLHAAQVTLPEVVVRDAPVTPLNTHAPVDSATRLGLPVREIPATVDVVDEDTMRRRGYRTVTEAIQGAVGVTAGDFPAEPAAFSLRGFSSSQINTLYNGIRIGPQNMTSRVMDSANLERVEVLRGPASLMSGEGAAGGAVNFVTRTPHTGAVENELFVSYGSFNTWRSSFGSGGSTARPGLDYRFDLSRSSGDGFVHDTHSENYHLSGQLDARVSSALKVFVAAEAKRDRASAYWGTPLVSAAFSGGNAKGGIIAGNTPALGDVAIDNRTLKTNYNVKDNVNEAEEYWLRGGVDWAVARGVTFRNQVYYYAAKREWKNAEVYAFAGGAINRDRFYIAHDQSLAGNNAHLTWDANVAGFENRLVVALEVSTLDFKRPGAGAPFGGDTVTVVDPNRGFYGPLALQRQTARIDTAAAVFEDRLKLTRTLALVGGVRHEHINLDRGSTDPTGADRAGFPFSKKWHPTTGRIGFTWETVPGLIFYGQYATGADVAANNLFLLGATQPLDLTRSRTYEAGVRHLFWDRRAEWTLAYFDIERRNVFAAQGGQSLNIAGRQVSNGVEAAVGVRPTNAWNLWANYAYTDARYEDYVFTGGTFSGNTPPNVPRVVANAGASYRFATTTPLEVGASVRYVGDRYNSDANNVKLLAYTVADAYAAVDLRKTRLAFRVRNLTNEHYAAWGDPFYPDQILLGARRSYEVSGTFRF